MEVCNLYSHQVQTKNNSFSRILVNIFSGFDLDDLSQNLLKSYHASPSIRDRKDGVSFQFYSKVSRQPTFCCLSAMLDPKVQAFCDVSGSLMTQDIWQTIVYYLGQNYFYYRNFLDIQMFLMLCMYLRGSHGLYSKDFTSIFKNSGRKMTIVKVVLP